MIDSNNILSLLGIPSEKIAFVDSFRASEDLSFVEISLVDDRPKCPCCNSSNVKIHGYYKVTINNSIIKTQKLYVTVEMRRYICKDCGKTFKQTFPFYLPHKSISRAVEISIIEALKDNVSYTFIARQYDVAVNTVISIFDKLPRQPRLQLPEVVCVDEFHFSNKNHKKLKYPFVISDAFNGTIIDIIESRTWDYLRSYFCNISLHERSKVKYFISDMYEGYRTLKKAFFPNAVHIVDHFHVMKLFNNAVQKVRTRIMKREEYGSKEYIFLKKHWKLFVCNRSELRKYRHVNERTGVVTDWEILVDKTLNYYPELFLVYWAREDFAKRVLKEQYWMEAKHTIDFFIQKFGHSEILELQEIAKTFSNWYEEIINAYSKTTYGCYLSNALAEANNNNIQTLIDLQYGLGLFERMRNRVLYINRSKHKKPGR